MLILISNRKAEKLLFYSRMKCGCKTICRFAGFSIARLIRFITPKSVMKPALKARNKNGYVFIGE